MSKFKRGDKVRLKQDAVNWSDHLYKKVFVVSDDSIDGRASDSVLQCVETYEDDFELVEPTPEQHVHHDLIVEWAKNPSRIVECKSFSDSQWNVVNDPSWYPENQYRFKPDEPERVFPQTTLSKEYLDKIYDESHTGEHDIALLFVANAAIKQYILDQEKELTA